MLRRCWCACAVGRLRSATDGLGYGCLMFERDARKSGLTLPANRGQIAWRRLTPNEPCTARARGQLEEGMRRFLRRAWRANLDATLCRHATRLFLAGWLLTAVGCIAGGGGGGAGASGGRSGQGGGDAQDADANGEGSSTAADAPSADVATSETASPPPTDGGPVSAADAQSGGDSNPAAETIVADVAQQPAECKPSKACTADGLCTKSATGCIAASNADCQQAAACKDHGKCTADGGKCTASGVTDCKNSTWCKSCSICALGKGECVSSVFPNCP